MSIEKERGFRQRNEISADRLPGKPWGTIRTVGLIVVMGSVLAVASPSPSAGNLLSWEIWNEPSLLAEIDPEVRVVTTTSAAPGDGALDRHSAGDSRFLRVENGEGVIFETADAGAITRIWMVQGDGVSEDLDPDIRLRIRLDGASNPIVDLPLPVFFSGRTPPFVEPMVLDRRRSGGGNVCFVPIAFRKGCRVSLTGAKEAKIWFQVSAVVLDDPAGITTFDGTEDLEEWRRMLERPGTDPWLGRPVVERQGETNRSGMVDLEPGEIRTVAVFEGADIVTGLVLRVPASRMAELTLHLDFDGHRTVDMPLPWFFGIPRPGCSPVRSLLIGVDQDRAYSYFPMPYRSRAIISLRLADTAPSPLRVRYAVRCAGRAPSGRRRIFGAEFIDVESVGDGKDAVLLDLHGGGRLAGLAVTVGTPAGTGFAFLEGDERMIIDGEEAWHGTGVEDFFGGGFYFRNEGSTPAPFRQPLHGLDCVTRIRESVSASLYRLMPLDGPVFRSGLRLLWEGGPAGDLPVRWRGVAWVYRTVPVR